MIRSHFQDEAVKLQGGLHRFRVHMPGTDPSGLQRQPSIRALHLIFFKDDFRTVPGIKVFHPRKRALDPLKKMNQSLSMRWEGQSGVKGQIDVMIIAQMMIGFHSDRVLFLPRVRENFLNFALPATGTTP